jgi:hypothetical protein
MVAYISEMLILEISFYYFQGVQAEVLAMRMGYDRKLSKGMVKALEQRLQAEIDKRTKS